MVHFFESYFNMGSIFWVMFETSGFNFYESMLKKKGSIYMSHVEDMGWILWVIVKRWVQSCKSYWKEGFNSVSHLRKKFNSLRLIQWVVFKKGSILRPIFQKNKSQFFESYEKKRFNSLSHIEKKCSILWIKLKRMVQFFESYFFKKVQFLKSFFTEGSMLRVFFFWKN